MFPVRQTGCVRCIAECDTKHVVDAANRHARIEPYTVEWSGAEIQILSLLCQYELQQTCYLRT